MNEHQRQAYMQAMAIDCYAPRLNLPGAKASVLCEMPLVATPCTGHGNQNPLPSPPAVAPGTQRANSRAAVMQALFDNNDAATAQKVNRSDLHTPVAPFAPQPQSGQSPYFALTIIRSPGILMIDEGGDATTGSADHMRLLQNMLFALGLTDAQPSLDPFIWPMVKNTRVDQSEVAARQTLEAFVARQALQLTATCVVVMGETPARYLGCEASAPGCFVEHSQLHIPLICCHSAVRALTEPALKAQIWRDLQPLVSMLKEKA